MSKKRSKKKPVIIVILGPTAVGKSDLAVRLAKKFNGEIISADSRQVYKGLDIATGKITKKEMRGVPHHLLSVAPPKKQFSASDYIEIARPIIFQIIGRGKLPIICGGTGFYISTLLGEIELADVPPNKKLRRQLKSKTARELYEILKKLDPSLAKTIDSKNPVRLIRAIEIAKAKLATYNPQPTTKLPHLAVSSPSGGESPNSVAKPLSLGVLKIGLNLPKEELRKRIHLRTLARIKKGMIGEAKRLHERSLSYRRMQELGLEYRLLAKYLNNKIAKKELAEQIEKENWHYAKRQLTWFKRDKEIKWFKPNDKKIEKIVKNFTRN